jgi:hypothetical protein
MYAVIRSYQNEAPDILDQIRTRADAIKDVIGSIEGFQAYYPARHAGRWFRV